MLIQQDFGTIYGGGELIVGVEKEVGTFTDEHGVTHKRYVKVIDFGALPNNTEKTVPHGITFTGIISMGGCAKYSSDALIIPIPHIGINSGGYNYINVFVDESNIRIRTDYNYSSFTQTYVTLEYYK